MRSNKIFIADFCKVIAQNFTNPEQDTDFISAEKELGLLGFETSFVVSVEDIPLNDKFWQKTQDKGEN